MWCSPASTSAERSPAPGGRARTRSLPTPAAARLVTALAAATLLAGACAGDAETRQHVVPVFGTLVRVDVAGADEATAESAFAALDALYARLDRDWRSFGDGELGRVNALLAAGRPAELSPELARLVARSLEIRDASGGLFDP